MQNSLQAVQTEPTRLPEVVAEVSHLQEAASSLDVQVQKIEEQLSAVLQRIGGEVAGSPAPPEPVRVPLADDLHGICRRIRETTERLHSISLRIEL